MRFLDTVCFSVLAVVAIGGCGDGRPTRVPVAGQVLIDGQPLTRGEIQFVSEVGRPSVAKLDREGRFRLSCFEENDGALLGFHKVSITAAEGLGPTKTRWYAPKKYANVNTSELTQEITGPVDDLLIEISWNGGREFVEMEEGTSVENEGFQGRRGEKVKPPQ